MKLLKYIAIYFIVSSGMTLLAVSDLKESVTSVLGFQVLSVALIIFLLLFLRRKIGRKRYF